MVECKQATVFVYCHLIDAYISFFFFFQAEDGIRDWSVTGVQTCALPISEAVALAHVRLQMNRRQVAAAADALAIEVCDHALTGLVVLERDDVHEPRANEIGRASCRERV